MPIQFQNVNPGDVISSSLMNQIFAKLVDLDTRLSILETSGTGTVKSIIDHFDPPAQQQVGQVLKIFGTFDFPTSLNTLTVDGVQITSFLPGTNDLKLVFLVPTSITIPVSGSKGVTVAIVNTKGRDQKSYLLLPPVSSSVPNPQINSVANMEDSIGDPTTLQCLKKTKISGANFAANPTDNTVKFTIQVGQQSITYPKQGSPALVIDAGQTNASQIVITAPDISEIGLNNPVPVVVEVDVGTAVPAFISSTIFHG